MCKASEQTQIDSMGGRLNPAILSRVGRSNKRTRDSLRGATFSPADLLRWWAVGKQMGDEAMATNLRPLARKLQQAIAIKRNRRISINQYQTYSQKAKRTVTKYVLSEYQTDDNGKGKYRTLLESWSLPEVVKFLAAILEGGA